MSIYYKHTAIEDIQRAASYIRSTFQNEEASRLVTAFLVGEIAGLADAPCTGHPVSADLSGWIPSNQVLRRSASAMTSVMIFWNCSSFSGDAREKASSVCTEPDASNGSCLSPVFLFFTVSDHPTVSRSSASWKTHRTIPPPSSEHDTAQVIRNTRFHLLKVGVS